MRTIASAAIALSLAVAAVPAAAVDFLVPGVSLGSVSLEPGARVRYLVVTQSFGSSDSSQVELAVLSHGRGEVRLEVSTAPYPPSRDETFTVRLRLAESVTSIESAEEFRGCLREIRIREGDEGFRAPTDDELDELAIEDLFVQSSAGAERRALESGKVAVPAGSFTCSGIETSRRSARTVTLGGVRAERTEEEVTRIYLSRDVPLWGLVKSRMEKRSMMRREGAPAAAPRITITESTLLSFERPRAR